jgi:DNA repair protein RadC
MTSLPFPTYRLQLVRETQTRPPETVVSDPTTAWQLLRSLLEEQDREHFVALALDARSRPIGAHTVSIGSVSASLMHPRELFKFAILANASALILAHNHPTGDPSPSSDDLALTRRLVEGGEILGIQVLDHLILGNGTFLSLKERGRM